jgi:hypothetical protein
MDVPYGCQYRDRSCVIKYKVGSAHLSGWTFAMLLLHRPVEESMSLYVSFFFFLKFIVLEGQSLCHTLHLYVS